MDAFTVIRGARRDLLFLCDHAANAVPPGVDLGLPAEEMARHIAWDVGAAGVTRALAATFDAPAVLSTFSRLVIDPNRGEDDPTILMKLYDGTIIPGNRHADAEERARRIALYHRPYHDAIRARIDAMDRPALISIHSFTPQLRQQPKRPWEIGILWDKDARIARPLIAGCRESGYVTGDNEPYSGALARDTMSTHGTARGLPHVLIEIRNDLIADGPGQRDWAGKLAPVLRGALETL